MQPQISQRIEQLRSWLIEQDLDAFIVPHEDEFLSEYMPKYNERLQWVTGFTGSAGAAIITRNKAVIFVDGRYTVQVRKQVPSDIFEYRHLIEEPLLEWIKDALPTGSKVGIDPKVHSAQWLQKTRATIGNHLSLKILATNPVDKFWTDRPEINLSQARLMPLDIVGQSSSEKRNHIAKLITEKNADAALLTQLDSICWLLNIRGLDISRLPVLLSHAIIYANSKVDFFIDSNRLNAEFNEHVGEGVSIVLPIELKEKLKSLSGKKVLVDPNTSNAWMSLTMSESDVEIINTEDVCLLPKAAKNSVEADGMRACHIIDGIAMTKFLAWFDTEIAAGKKYDEGELANKLQAFREEAPSLVDLSFDTISAAGSNAAMCHYHHTNQPEPSQLEMDNIYLVDSGGQYVNGTTDITRTLPIGNPSDEIKQQFTLVLKGHISLATAHFPKGTTGSQLDILARQHLWSKGYDYDHGTGHGVGHFLSVHEGPQRISKSPSTTALQPGMVLSNEPGYYRADAFGIRIENLELVVEVETQGDFSILGFESLTRCPIDKRLINVDMLTHSELEWLNDYHRKVWNDISPLVDGEVKKWLKQAADELKHN